VRPVSRDSRPVQKTHSVNRWRVVINLHSTTPWPKLGLAGAHTQAETHSKTELSVKKLLLVTLSAGALFLCHPVLANSINILGAGDFAADDISSITGKNGLGDANVLAWLQAEAASHGFPAPTTGEEVYTGGPIVAGDYLVLHYGSGTDGTSAGGLVALYFDADQASFAVPANGSGPSGLGGISGAFLFDHTDGNTVPDSGGTLALLGIGIVLLAMARRQLSVS